ncbi:DUF229 domain-containing protein [Candidatus Kaiserbacteria bacterium]|nr:DUF229 domain-containing protein [Candidatus Kaiserbacteria bacterium]
MKKSALLGGVLLVAFIVFGIFTFGAKSSVPSDVSCKDCNVIIIGVDTLRADHVHALGYPLDTTPTIDALADKGFVFSQAISASSWTVPAFMSIMTGVYPSVHRVTNKYVEFDPKDTKKQILSNLEALSPGIGTLAEEMKSAGYATGGFTGDAGVGHAFGYSQGFDVYTDEKAFGGLENSDTHVLTWLDSLKPDQKFFMFFHGYDLHGQFTLASSSKSFIPQDYTGPYTGSPEEEAKLREDQLVAPLSLTPADVGFWKGLYDSKVHAADSQLAKFLSQLQERGLLQHTIIVLVSDHGEEWYEHGGVDHGQSLYDELIHVPLIVSVPGAKSGVVPSQVSTMDIAPTILDLLGISPDAVFAKQLEGKSLLPYMTGRETGPGRDIFVETDYRDFTHKRAVRTADGWKYIITLESGKEELYNLNVDPSEKDNIVLKEVEKATVLKNQLREHIEVTLGGTLSSPAKTGCLPVYPTECI